MSSSLPHNFRIRWSWYASLLLLVFLLGLFPLVNGDIWWHLRTGQLILERGQVPDTDWFTYTNPQAKWIDLHWGFQVVAATLWGIGGAAALVLFKCCVGVGTFGLGLSTSGDDTPPWQTVIAWLPSVMIFSGRFYARPEILSLLLIAGFIAVLHHSWQRPKLLWVLPILQCAWVNTQGLFVLGGVLLGCFWAEWLRRYLRPSSDSQPPKISPRVMVSVTLATAGAVFVNPYGWRGAIFPLQLFAKVRGEDRAFFFQFSAELAGLTQFVKTHPIGVFGLFADLSSGLLVILFLMLVITLSVLAARRQVNLFHILMVIAFAYLSWQMRRNSVIFAVIGGYVLQQNVVWLSRSVKGKPKDKSHWWPAASVALVVGLLIVSLPTGVYYQLRRTFPPRQLGWGVSPLYPHGAAEFLKQDGMPDRIYAINEAAAAVCIYHLGPDKRVFADARLETNTRETLELYQSILGQIATDYSELSASLRAGPGKKDAELPALVIDMYLLINSSRRMPRLLAGLLEGEKNHWRCVYCPFPPAAVPLDDRLPASPNVLLGACVFLHVDKAQELKLADRGEALKRLLLRIRRSR